MDAPCKNCTDRTVTCHGWCERYTKYAEEREMLRNKINKIKNSQHEYTAMHSNAMNKLKRRKNRLSNGH